MACIIPGCPNQADNNFGVRLRRPNTSAIWAPNTLAQICDDHAAQGMKITVMLEPSDTGRIETRIHGVVNVAERTTDIVNTP